MQVVLIEVLLVMELDAVQAKCQSVVIMFVLVTFIAAYRYIRIFNLLLTVRLL